MAQHVQTKVATSTSTTVAVAAALIIAAAGVVVNQNVQLQKMFHGVQQQEVFGQAVRGMLPKKENPKNSTPLPEEVQKFLAVKSDEKNHYNDSSEHDPVVQQFLEQADTRMLQQDASPQLTLHSPQPSQQVELSAPEEIQLDTDSDVASMLDEQHGVMVTQHRATTRIASPLDEWSISLTAVAATQGDQEVKLEAPEKARAASTDKIQRTLASSVSADYAVVNGVWKDTYHISKPIGDDKDALKFVLSVMSTAELSVENNSVFFTDDRTDKRLASYGNLIVTDAASKTLPAHFEIQDRNIAIVVDTKDAQYPIAIDPDIILLTEMSGSGGANTYYGYAMATGDVNGDGEEDLLVSEPAYSGTYSREGAVYVYHVVDGVLSSAPNTTILGNQAILYLGAEMTLGDVNGDGYDDALISSTGIYHNAYLYNGSSAGLSTSYSWSYIPSAHTVEHLGSAIGDINNDSVQDIVLLDTRYDETLSTVSFFYGVSGSIPSSTPDDQIPYDSLLGGAVPGIILSDVNGDGYEDMIYFVVTPFDNGYDLMLDQDLLIYYGSSSGINTTVYSEFIEDIGVNGVCCFTTSVPIAEAGDVNGDGYNDVVVGDISTTGGFYVFFGGASGLSTTPDRSIIQSSDLVSGINDINSDGYDDIVVGDYFFSDSYLYQGAMFVYLGSSTGPGSSEDAIIEGSQFLEQFPHSVASLPDLNGDASCDFLIGSPYYDNGTTSTGIVYVYSFCENGITDTNSDISAGQSLALAGSAVANAGDVNNDGYDDVVVTAPQYSNGMSNEGAVFVFHGSAAGTFSIPDWSAEGNRVSAFFGTSVTAAGDINDDGYDDLAVGSLVSQSAPFEGAVLVYYGSSSGLSLVPNWVAAGKKAMGFYGYSLASGDVNEDDMPDLVVGSPLYSNGEINEGLVEVFYNNGTALPKRASVRIQSNYPGALFGTSVAVGDSNDDYIDDLLVGAPKYTSAFSEEGSALLYLGASAGLSTSATWQVYGGLAGANLGTSVAFVGDMNEDGNDDIAVGAPYYDNGEADEGLVQLFYGNTTAPSTTPDWSLEGNAAGANIGWSIGTNIEYQGHDGMALGAPSDALSTTDAGSAYLYIGSSTGPTAYVTVTGDQAGSRFGSSLAGLDYDNDGSGDLIVGAPYYDSAYSDEGQVSLFVSNCF